MTVTATGAGMLMSEEPAVGSSNTDGDFELTGLRAGTYHVAISDFPEGIEFPVTTRDVTVGVGLSANVSFSAPGEDTGTGDTDAFVFISEVASGTGDARTTDGPHTGSVTVTASVERGTARFEKLTLYVDGVEVDSQDFGTAASAPGDDPELAAQQVIPFKLGFNSAKHNPETGDPDYMNGEHTLHVDLALTGGETISSNRVTVAFSNEDRYELTLAADGNQARDGEGLVWNSGAVTAKVLPVIYSGAQTISQVTLGLRDTDGDPLISSRGGDNNVGSITDDEAPFEVTWENANATSSNPRRVGGIEPGAIVVHLVSSAYSDGTAGPKATPAATDDTKPYFLRLDNQGPTVSNINRAMQFNRHYDITNWVGSGHTFTFSSSSTTPDFSDGGVGRDRSHHQYNAGASTAEDDLKAVSMPSDLDETSNNRAYVLGATVRDLLGNETMVWWAGADSEDGLANSGSNRGTVDSTDDYKFGVDLTAPTQELVEDDTNIGPTGGVISNVAIAALITAETRTGRNEVEIDYDDPGTGSGFSGSNAPVHTRIRRYAPGLSARAGCIMDQAYWHSSGGGACEILGDPGSNQWRTDPPTKGGTTGSYDFANQENGYYAVEYAVMDDAGNRAPFIQTGGVIDETAPVGSALVPAARAIGGRSTLQAFASDNLDLDRVEFYLGFTGDGYQMGSQSVGSPSLPFEQSANASISIETFPAGVQSAAGAPTALSAHVVRILDQAGNPTYASALVSATGDAPRDLLTAFVVETVMAESDVDEDGTTGGRTRSNVYTVPTVANDAANLCWDADGDGDCADAAEARATLTFALNGTGTAADLAGGADGVTLEAEAPGNPFERVVFYVQRETGLTDLDGVTTTWAYLGEGRGRAPEDNPDDDDATADRGFSWRLNVRGADVAEAAGLVAIPGAALNFRAVGYTDDGTAVTVDANGTITLSDD